MESSQEEDIEKFNKEINVTNWMDLYNILNKKKHEINNNVILSSQNYLINTKINELIKLLEEKLKENCVHELEHDYIEIDIERYEKICYCIKCMLTF
jgi:ADP-glucose pyrophosphorylase